MATILLVDDNPDMLTMLAEILEGEGHAVRPVRSAQHALHVLKNSDTLPDLIISDWTMPIMGGEELIAALRHDGDWQHIPVLVISGGDQEEQIAMQAGAAGFIKKPFAVPDMLAVVKTIVA